ncbi:hypothetical protein TURU_168389 [Turdus rufiventris]|nr:hypothetical protein TURU_168389 [Turdus rufiventris]
MNQGSRTPVSLDAGKVMEQIILSTNTQHVQDNQGIRPSQHRFAKTGSCLTNLISLCAQLTLSVDERKAVAFIYLDVSKAFEPCPTAFSWRSWLLMAWTGVLSKRVKNWRLCSEVSLVTLKDKLKATEDWCMLMLHCVQKK